MIADGRAALVSQNIVTANADFQAAVAADPANQEANVLYAASQILVLETGTAAQTLLNTLAVSSTGRNIFHWSARSRPGFPASHGLTSDTFKSFATTVLLPQLELARQNLAAVTGTDFSTTLNTQEDGLADVTIDYGDVQLLRALVDAAIAGIDAGDEFNTFVKSTDIVLWLKKNALTVQQLVNKNPALLTSTNGSYAAAVTAFSSSVDEYVAASDFIRNRADGTSNLFAIDPSEAKAEARLRNEMVNLQASITGTAAIGTTQVHLGALASFGGSLRTLLPRFEENHAVPGTFPDLTFGGVLPSVASQPVQQFFVRLGNGLDRRFRHHNSPKDVSVSITSPAKKAKISASSTPVITGSGKAKSAIGVADVVVAVTDHYGLVQTATASGNTSWSCTFSHVTPGPNVMTAYATDIAGIQSAVQSRPFTYVKFEPLPVSVVSGTVAGTSGGTVTQGFYPSSSRQLAVSYTIKAKPAAGYIFQSWTSATGHVYDPVDYPDDTYYSGAATYTFPMTEGLALQANFIPTPFPSLAGQYAAQVAVNGPNGSETQGFITLTLTGKGAFTAKLTAGGKSSQFKGKFDGLGIYNAVVQEGAGSYAYVYISINDLSDPTQGVIFDVAYFKHGNYAEDASGYLSQVPASNNVSGNYTMLIDPDNSDPSSPQGNGWGTVVIQPNGYVTFNGKLADGTPLAFTTALFNGGNGYAWDISIPLSNGSGWLSGEMDPQTTGSNDFTGSLYWSVAASGTGTFPSGFTVFPSAVTSPYTKQSPVLDVSPPPGNLEVSTTDGGLASGIDDFVTLTTSNGVNVPAGADKLKISINSANGVFTGSFLDVDSDTTINLSGVILQNQGEGSGFFIGTGQSGVITLTPQ